MMIIIMLDGSYKRFKSIPTFAQTIQRHIDQTVRPGSASPITENNSI